MNTCLQGLGSARLQGKLQGIVYIDDIIIMIILHTRTLLSSQIGIVNAPSLLTIFGRHTIDRMAR